MSIKKLLALSALYLFSHAVLADVISLRENAPTRYVVQKGDTLWDISGRFLENPWRWPEVWSFNPQIENPHLIYPGDVVVLTYDEAGKPILTVERGRAAVKLSPQIHASRADAPISSIPLDAIKQFLGLPRLVTESELNSAAYVVSSLDQRLISGKEDEIYARGVMPGTYSDYVIFRVGQAYRNEGAKRTDILGYEALHVAEAKITNYADPSTLRISHSTREVLTGDRLLPKLAPDFNQNFVPHAPSAPVAGQIIAVVDGVSRIGQFQTVVINVGERDGVEAGHVLAVNQSGATVRDTVSQRRGDKVTLPDVRAGFVMVIKPYDRLSYALVMEAERDMRVYDKVGNP